MTVPDFQSLMLSALKALGSGRDFRLTELRVRVADMEGLTKGDLAQKQATGESLFANRLCWSLTYLTRAELTERVGRGVFRLSETGKALLADEPDKVDIDLLRQYPAFAKWKSGPARVKQDTASADTPEEAIEQAVQGLHRALEADLLQQLLEAPPSFLERVVVDLLITMGYRGGNAAKGLVTGRTGEGAIDGTIREDALGLDEVYMMAKRSAEGSKVGESDLRNFAGAIDAARTTKGVFVTTAVPRPERARAAEPFSPERLVAHLRATGKPAHYLLNAESTVAFLAAEAGPGDLVVFMSNGGFGGLQQKLCAALTARASCID